MRSISRQSLDLLTENTATFCRYALLSESLAKGRSRISAASSFFARSSSFGFEPERLWCQEPYLPRHPDVALDRREAHPEKAGASVFGIRRSITTLTIFFLRFPEYAFVQPCC
jgi:hypothetical protein